MKKLILAFPIFLLVACGEYAKEIEIELEVMSQDDEKVYFADHDNKKIYYFSKTGYEKKVSFDLVEGDKTLLELDCGIDADYAFENPYCKTVYNGEKRILYIEK